MRSVKRVTSSCGSILPFCLLLYVFVLMALGSRYFMYAIGSSVVFSIDNQSPESTPLEVSALSQIGRSDNMRGNLFEYGINQLAINPLFGTGRLAVDYYIPTAGDTFRSTPHSFIIETMICYGLVGFVVLAALFVLVVLDMIKTTRRLFGWKQDAWGALVVSIVYFGIGSVQPIVYQPIAVVLYCSILAFFLCSDSGDIIETKR